MSPTPPPHMARKAGHTILKKSTPAHPLSPKRKSAKGRCCPVCNKPCALYGCKPGKCQRPLRCPKCNEVWTKHGCDERNCREPEPDEKLKTRIAKAEREHKAYRANNQRTTDQQPLTYQLPDLPTVEPQTLKELKKYPEQVEEFIRIEALLRSETVKDLYARQRTSNDTEMDLLQWTYAVEFGWKVLEGAHWVYLDPKYSSKFNARRLPWLKRIPESVWIKGDKVGQGEILDLAQLAKVQPPIVLPPESEYHYLLIAKSCPPSNVLKALTPFLTQAHHAYLRLRQEQEPPISPEYEERIKSQLEQDGAKILTSKSSTPRRTGHTLSHLSFQRPTMALPVAKNGGSFPYVWLPAIAPRHKTQNVHLRAYLDYFRCYDLTASGKTATEAARAIDPALPNGKSQQASTAKRKGRDKIKQGVRRVRELIRRVEQLH